MILLFIFLLNVILIRDFSIMAHLFRGINEILNNFLKLLISDFQLFFNSSYMNPHAILKKLLLHHDFTREILITAALLLDSLIVEIFAGQRSSRCCNISLLISH
jgi:hypothetical protein